MLLCIKEIEIIVKIHTISQINKPLSVLTATACGIPLKSDSCVSRARYTIPNSPVKGINDA